MEDARPLNIKKIKETCLYVSDLDASRSFYEGIMGLPVITIKEGRHIFFRAGEDVLLCFIAETTANDVHLPPHFAKGHQHFAFECAESDLNDWKQLLLKHPQQWEEIILMLLMLQQLQQPPPHHHHHQQQQQ